MMRERAQQLAASAAAALKKARHARYYWCRLHNGFLDMPLWRSIAAKTGLHLTVVQAFVVRLDSFANQQEPRGDVTYFDPVEFGAALDITEEQAGRLFAALEDGDNPWIEQDHLSGFYHRNSDGDRDHRPTSDAERKERSRRFRLVLKELVRMKNAGLISPDELTRRQIRLTELRDLGRRRKLTWDEQKAGLVELTKLSTVTQGHDRIVTGAVDGAAQTSGGAQKNLHRDNRDGHPRAEQKFKPRTVENSGDAASGIAAGLSDAAAGEAELILRTEIRRYLIETIGGQPGRVDMLIARWLVAVGEDHGALVAIIRSVAARFAFSPEAKPSLDRFVGVVDVDVKQHCERLTAGLRLPLMLKVEGGAADHPQAVTTDRDRDGVDNSTDGDVGRRKAVGGE